MLFESLGIQEQAAAELLEETLLCCHPSVPESYHKIIQTPSHKIIFSKGKFKNIRS